MADSEGVDSNDAAPSELRVRGDRIIHLAYQQGYTLGQLATLIHIPREQLSRKVNGHRPWWAAEVLALAEALGTTVAYLVNESDNPF